MPTSRRLRAFGVLLLVTWGLTTHGKPSVSGDEPHYLMQAESLLADRDLDLANNYARGDGRHFGQPGLVNDGHAVPRPDGTLGSTHDPGLVVLLMPAYAAARSAAGAIPERLLARARLTTGLLTYALVSVTLVALVSWSASGLLPILAAAWPRGNAELLLYLIALSPPIVSHAFLLFPDTVMFALVCVVIARVVPRPGSPTGAPAVRALLVAAMLLGFAPWLHRKFSLFALALALGGAWMRRDDLRVLSARHRAALAAALLLPHAAFYAWSWWQWHSLLGPQFVSGPRLDVARVPVGLLALFADANSGLLAYAPIYAVLPACVGLAAPPLRPLIAASAALVLPMAAFDEWWGGYAPAARYLVPVMPIAAVCLASALRRERVRRAVLTLAALQVVIDALIWQTPRLLWPRAGGNALHRDLGPLGAALQAWLPQMRGAPPAATIAVFLASLAAVTWWLMRPRAGESGAADARVDGTRHDATPPA